MNISLICACKNRYDALIVSLNSWLRFDQIKEIIIVDWSSDQPLSHLSKLDERIKIVTVPDQKYFNQPQPLNLAASLATGDYILKVDTDYIINPYFNFFEKYIIDENSFVSGHHNIKSPEFVDSETGLSLVQKDQMTIEDWRSYVNSYSHYFKYLTGLLYVSRNNFLKIGGYNESLNKYYAFEDDEICQRLELFGLEHKKIDYDHMLVHLPHPDSKRLENFAGWTDEDKKVISNLSGDTLWNYEYFMSQMHIKKNKELCAQIVDYYVDPKINWNIQQIDEQIYYAKKNISNKLVGMPTIYCVSLEESQNRRDNFESQFGFYDIKPNFFISKRFAECNERITGQHVDTLNDGTKGCVLSHLRAIKDWYENSDDDYGFFAEDDLSLETVSFWDFTWETFIGSLPDDADCVQLFTIRDKFDTFELRERYWNDWGASAYIITRNYAHKLIDTFVRGDSFHLEIPNLNIMPLIENILFASVGKTYTIPLFVEDIRFESTFVGMDDDVSNGQKTNHRKARELVLEYWKNKSNHEINTLKPTIEKTELENLLEVYSLDTENPEHNFNLGVWYENQGHTAPALSYFLRCAERAAELDKTLAYEALIRSSYCYFKQGTRDGSGRSLLWQAQMLMKNRPEAYFLLARYARKQEWWQDCYSSCELALLYCDFNLPQLKTNVEYFGRQGLLYEKAISGWWWGKVDESRSIFQQLLDDKNLSEHDHKVILDHLRDIGVKI